MNWSGHYSIWLALHTQLGTMLHSIFCNAICFGRVKTRFAQSFCCSFNFFLLLRIFSWFNLINTLYIFGMKPAVYILKLLAIQVEEWFDLLAQELHFMELTHKSWLKSICLHKPWHVSCTSESGLRFRVSVDLILHNITPIKEKHIALTLESSKWTSSKTKEIPTIWKNLAHNNQDVKEAMIYGAKVCCKFRSYISQLWIQDWSFLVVFK